MYCFCKSLARKEYNKSVNLKAVSCYICSGVGGSVGGGGGFCLFLIGRGHNRFACLFFLYQRGRKRI